MNKPIISNPYVAKMRDAVATYWNSCREVAENYYQSVQRGTFSDMYLHALAANSTEATKDIYQEQRNGLNAVHNAVIEAVKHWDTASGANLVKEDVDLLNSGLKLSEDDVAAMCKRNAHNATMLRLIRQKVDSGCMAINMDIMQQLYSTTAEKKLEAYDTVYNRAAALMDNLKAMPVDRLANLLHSEHAVVWEARYMDFCNPELFTCAPLYAVVGDGSELATV